MVLLLIGYFFLYIERPWEVWPRLAPYRIERVYMLLAMGVFALWRGKRLRWGAHPLLVATFLGLHYAFAPFAFSPRAALDQGFEYLKMAVSYFLIIWSVRDEAELRTLVHGYAGVMGLYLLHSFREYLAGRHWYRMGIVRMVGVGQFANDPNAFAASIAFSLPFVLLVLRTDNRRWAKAACIAYGGLALYCIVLTGSRAGFVTLALFGLLVIGQAGGRRMVSALVAALILASIGWEVMPEDKKLRIETIWNPEAGPAGAQASAEGRIEGLKAGLRIMARRPLTGAGPGGENFMRYRAALDDGSATQAHNLFGEVLGEMGLLGGFVFLAQVAAAWVMAGKARILLSSAPTANLVFLDRLAIACRQGLALMLFNGLFGHNLYRANWLWIGAWSFLAHRFQEDRAHEVQPSRLHEMRRAAVPSSATRAGRS